MRLVALMIMAAAIWLGSTVPAQAQGRGMMGSSCAGPSANGSSALSMGSMAGFSGLNGNPSLMTSGANLGVGMSSLMAGGFNPNLNFAASSGMLGGFNSNAFLQGSNGLGGFNNGFGMGATNGPTVWTDGFNNGFSMGMMAARNNGLAARGTGNAMGNDPIELEAAAVKAAQARGATKATTLRMRTTAKRPKARAKTTKSASSVRS
jgi:hypothetical protein